jgi:hypothetical protein
LTYHIEPEGHVYDPECPPEFLIINFSARQTACSELDDWFIARDAGSVSLFHDEIVGQVYQNEDLMVKLPGYGIKTDCPLVAGPYITIHQSPLVLYGELGPEP